MDGSVLAVLHCSCLSKQSGDSKSDDLTSGSMSTPPNVDKSRPSQQKR